MAIMAIITATRLPSLLSLLTLLLSIYAQFAHATPSTTASPSPSTSPSSSNPITIQSSSGWTYYGCFNETTLANGTEGARALNGGSFEAADIMTVELCLAYCKSGGWGFAGLEYTRECYCAPLVSSLSARLPESACDLPCMGNKTEICGGSLSLTVYHANSASQGAGAKVGRTPFEGVGSVLALGIAVVGLLCLA